MNGSASPLFGSALVTTPTLMKACKPMRSVMPAASIVPNVSRAWVAM
jgi:hypothetical protein